MTPPRLLRTLLTIAGLASVMSVASASDVISNGSFESFITTPGGAVEVSGWATGGTALVSAFPGAPDLGVLSLQLSPTGYARQSFTVVAGQTYQAQFWIGGSPASTTFWGRLGGDPFALPDFPALPMAGCSGYAAFGVVGTDTCAQFNSATIATQQGITWTAPTDGLAYLTFVTLSEQQMSQGGVIDGVVLSNVVTPVPEPSALALMLAGLGVVGLMARRSRPQGPPQAFAA
jgi:hypothetical protein